MADEIADDSDDEKRIARAERQADRIKKRAVARKGGAGKTVSLTNISV